MQIHSFVQGPSVTRNGIQTRITSSSSTCTSTYVHSSETINSLPSTPLHRCIAHITHIFIYSADTRLLPSHIPSPFSTKHTIITNHPSKSPQTRLSATSSPITVNSATSSDKGPVVVVDNYDSFTYNLCQYLGDLNCDFIVYPNDAKTVEQIKAMNPRGILVSPGPGRPEDSGISLEIIEKLGPEGFPIFGVCMGHQCIGQVFGGKIIRAPSGVMHGKTSPVFHTDIGLLKGLENPFLAARYHSLVIDKDSCPDDLEVTAWCEDGTIMGVRHKKYPHIQGVQFHPESIITQNGKTIVKNFVESL